VFNSTGEIVVFFERSPIDLQEKGLDKDAKLQKELEAFRAFANSEINNLKAQGYKCFKSQEKHVKLSVTKSQVYVVNTDTREEHYGIILAKLDTLPKVIAGLPSPEALKLEIEQFYKKP
jgi:biotin operon repressor